MKTPIVLETNLSGLNPPKRGKVRDIYDLDDSLLIVATDRISAFDVVLPNGVPEKGKVLTMVSENWFEITDHIVDNHLITTDVDKFPVVCYPHKNILTGRSMLVKKATPLPVECIVRGYLTGSGLKEYRATGSICGMKLPPGLTEASCLRDPIFTPSSKAGIGEHDVNISFNDVVDLVGIHIASQIRDYALDIYHEASIYAGFRGLIIADTKLEFGIYNGEVILIDEVLTPDSSRFWPKADYREGVVQKSFDKQFVRDYLESLKWNKKPPAPNLPEDVIQKTSEKYLEVMRKLI